MLVSITQSYYYDTLTFMLTLCQEALGGGQGHTARAVITQHGAECGSSRTCCHKLRRYLCTHTDSWRDLPAFWQHLGPSRLPWNASDVQDGGSCLNHNGNEIVSVTFRHRHYVRL